jgi:hypothetical protein
MRGRMLEGGESRGSRCRRRRKSLRARGVLGRDARLEARSCGVRARLAYVAGSARDGVCRGAGRVSVFNTFHEGVPYRLPSDPITNAPYRRTGGGFIVSKESEYLVLTRSQLPVVAFTELGFVSGMTQRRPLVHCATMATTPAPVSARLASRGDPCRSARCAAERDAGHGRASRASPSPKTLGGRRHAILTSGATVSGLLFPREALAYGLGKAPPRVRQLQPPDGGGDPEGAR